MHSRYRTWWLGLICSGWLLLAAGAVVEAFPTILNYVPNCDTVAKGRAFAQVGNFKFHFKNAPPAPFVDHSLIYSLTFGFTRTEVGVDVIGDRSFSNPDSGLYAGPVAFSVKHRLLTEGTGRDRFSFAIGVMNLGVTRHSEQFNEWWVPSPYLVFGKKAGAVNLSLGYQWNLNGAHDLDLDRNLNRSVIVGADTVLIKHSKRPVTLLADWYGGRAGCLGLGLTQPFGHGFSWAFSLYLPNHDRFKVARFEIPRQHYFGIGYTFGLR